MSQATHSLTANIMHLKPRTATCQRRPGKSLGFLRTPCEGSRDRQRRCMTEGGCRTHLQCRWKLCYAAGCTCMFQGASRPLKHKYISPLDATLLRTQGSRQQQQQQQQQQKQEDEYLELPDRSATVICSRLQRGWSAVLGRLLV